jgi:uncharacterized protein YjbI with pentapeptide repeats
MSLIIIGGGLIYILVETIKAKNTGFEAKTLWDWMDLLIVPFVLAIGAILINLTEKNREQQIADNRIREDRQLAEDRAKLEREIAIDRQQEAALQSYIDRIAALLLEKDLQYPETSEVIRKVATIRTLTLLRGLDPIRKGLVLFFLKDAGLIYKKESIIHLEGTDLQNARLRFADLKNTDLRGADFADANLEHADLRGADLRFANLKNVNLRFAMLESTDLENANMEGANLQYANVLRANLQYVNLKNAHLQNTLLVGTNLQSALLDGVDLHGATLRDAILEHSNVTDEQLATAGLLKDTIMPDGTKHD